MDDKIVLAITEEEAGILQAALSQWRNSRISETQRLTLTAREKQKVSRELNIGKMFFQKLQAMLIDRRNMLGIF